MNYSLMVIVALLLAYAGMTALSLTMDRHHNQVRRRDTDPAVRVTLRIVGLLLLLGALLPCTHLWGIGAGVTAWIGMLTTGALLTAGLLAYAPRWAAPVAAGSAVAGMLGLSWLLA